MGQQQELSPIKTHGCLQPGFLFMVGVLLLFLAFPLKLRLCPVESSCENLRCGLARAGN